jgi:hypothetical protein
LASATWERVEKYLIALENALRGRADVIFGIYGFDFCHKAWVSGLELVPLYGYPECRDRGEHREVLLLTGYGKLPIDLTDTDLSFWTDKIQPLADGITFCQQQPVVVTRLIRISAGDSVEDLIQTMRLPPELPTLQESRSRIGALVGGDAFFPESRRTFLELFLDLVAREEENLPLTAALYRQIEIWRLSRPLIDLRHFLAFSGLEILSRVYGPHPTNQNVAVPMSGLLRQHGFNVPQKLAEEWAEARNEAFHHGRLEFVSQRFGKTIRLVDQLYQLITLLGDLSLKLLGFDDGHINWNRWRDRAPFI